MSQPMRIVAATDLSAPARRAAERAASVSIDTASALDLVHVADLGTLERLRERIAGLPSGLEVQVLDTARERLEALAESIRQTYGVVVATHVTSGPLLASLSDQASALRADLLVCGAKGESLLRHWVLGSTATRLLSTAAQPVLIVKQAPRGPYKKVLVAVDFSSYSLAAIQAARRIAPKAGIVLFHAFELPFEGTMRYAQVAESAIDPYRNAARDEALSRLKRLRDLAGLSPMQATVRVRHGNPTLRIVEEEQALDCDLIVMGKHGEGFVQELLVGSVTRRVLSECSGDVLVSTHKSD